MARLFFNIWPFTPIKTLPNGLQNLPKTVQNVTKYLINPQKVAQSFEDFAKMAKFRQIWSHWEVGAVVVELKPFSCYLL